MTKTKRKVPRRTAAQTTLSEREWKIVEAIADELECSHAEAIRHAVVSFASKG